MTNAELNRRLRYFATYGLAYSDVVWRLLAEAWAAGYHAHKRGEQDDNPYAPVLPGKGPERL